MPFRLETESITVDITHFVTEFPYRKKRGRNKPRTNKKITGNHYRYQSETLFKYTLMCTRRKNIICDDPYTILRQQINILYNFSLHDVLNVRERTTVLFQPAKVRPVREQTR